MAKWTRMLPFPTIQRSKTSLPRGTEYGPKKKVWDAANEDKPKPSAKKRKREDPEVVSVPLAGVAISCLMQGQRPTKSDVVVPLEASQLEPIFELLQEDADQLKARKPYQRKVQQEQKQPEEAAPNM